MIEMVIPSSKDPTLAPQGAHVCLMFTQYTPYRLNGRDWTEQDKNNYADIGKCWLVLVFNPTAVCKMVLHHDKILNATAKFCCTKKTPVYRTSLRSTTMNKISAYPRILLISKNEVHVHTLVFCKIWNNWRTVEWFLSFLTSESVATILNNSLQHAMKCQHFILLRLVFGNVTMLTLLLSIPFWFYSILSIWHCGHVYLSSECFVIKILFF